MAPPTVPFRIAFVPGVTPDRWSRIWAQRMPRIPLELIATAESDQLAALDGARADMCFVRLPVDREGLSLIPLYREIAVVVVPVDHPVSAYDEITVADLAGEHLLHGEDAIEQVATGAGVAVVPKSVARLHHRKDVTSRPVSDAPEPQIGLAWRTSTTDARVETFIGIVRGRTERSSRGR